MWNGLKEVPLTIVIALLATLILILGLTGGFTIWSFTLEIADVYARIAAVAVAISLFVLVYFISDERPSPIPSAAGVGSLPNTTTIPRNASDFLWRFGEPRVQSFSDMTNSAIKVSILARTTVNLIGQHRKTLEELCRSGCDIQLLLVDPKSETAKYLYADKYELYKNNISTAGMHLQEAQAKYPTRITAKCTVHAPTMSIMIVEKPIASNSFIQVQLYFLHGAVGADRPLFIVRHGDPWYNVFREEFEQLWRSAHGWAS